MVCHCLFGGVSYSTYEEIIRNYFDIVEPLCHTSGALLIPNGIRIQRYLPKGVLKEKFHASTDNSEKVTILTILPKSWSVQKVQEEFGVSNYMARKAKDLVKNQGILSNPNPKHGCGLPLTTVNLVRDFYEFDDTSRIMFQLYMFVPKQFCLFTF